jgi:hypothetical protein
MVPEGYSFESADQYLGLLFHPDCGKVITNISEFLLTHENKKPANISFWFKLGLDLYENMAPHQMDRHMIFMALFYSANAQYKTAENLYRGSLKKMKNDVSYSKAMGYNMYGRMLLKVPERKDHGIIYLERSEKMMTVLPHWHDKIDNVFLYDDIL